MRRVLYRSIASRAALHGSEVTQVIRRHAAKSEIDGERGRIAIADLLELPLRLYPHDFLLPRIWDLRESSDGLRCRLCRAGRGARRAIIFLTRDKRVAAAASHHAQIELV
jgi:predicted nucleic acid-binding protein